MPRVPKSADRDESEDKDKDCVWKYMRLSNEAWGMLGEMSQARGGGPSAKHIVLEEALRLFYDQDPMLARKRKKAKAPAAPPEGSP